MGLDNRDYVRRNDDPVEELPGASWWARLRAKIQRFFAPPEMPGSRKGGVHSPHNDQHEDEVDRILDKIAKDGMDSLSDEDKAFLEKTSKRYQGWDPDVS